MELKELRALLVGIVLVFSVQACGVTMHSAAWNGDKEAVTKFLESGVDVNIKTDGGATPLHLAAERGNDDVAELLIYKGADVNSKDNAERPFECGYTPLHYASTYGHNAVIKLLLGKGADVNARGRNGWTPLHSAAFSGQKDAVELLLGRGADVNLKDKDGNTPLHLAALFGFWKTIYGNAGSDVKVKGDGLLVLEKVKPDMLVKVLRGSKVRIRDNGELLLVAGRALYTVSDGIRIEKETRFVEEGQNVKIIKLLVNKGADVNAKNGSLFAGLTTPLHLAASWGNKGAVSALLDSGADVNALDSDGHTALYLANVEKFVDVVALLKQRGAS